MKNTLFVGLAIGMVAGACIASNSYKARQVVTGAQEQIKNKLCPAQDNGASESENGQNQSGM